MSKKDFIALAEVLTDESLSRNAQVIQGMVDINDLRGILADFCKSQNSAFMRARWLDYIAGKCGKNGGAVKAA